MNQTDKWDMVVSKFKKRFLDWKANLLSVGGSLILIKSPRIKSPLNNLGILYMSLFKMHKLVLVALEL